MFFFFNEFHEKDLLEIPRGSLLAHFPGDGFESITSFVSHLIYL